MKQLFIQRINYPIDTIHYDRFIKKLVNSLEDLSYYTIKLLLKSYTFAKHALYSQFIAKINLQARQVILALTGQPLLSFAYGHIEIMSSLTVHNQEILIQKVLGMEKRTRKDWLGVMNFLAVLRYEHYFQFDKYNLTLNLQIFQCIYDFTRQHPNI